MKSPSDIVTISRSHGNIEVVKDEYDNYNITAVSPNGGRFNLLPTKDENRIAQGIDTCDWWLLQIHLDTGR